MYWSALRGEGEGPSIILEIIAIHVVNKTKMNSPSERT
jgi:hypothetical protein